MITTGTTPATALREATHELNNLCATIIGFAALAEESDQKNSDIAGYLREIRIATEAVAVIARQLRALAQELEVQRSSPSERKLVDQTGIEPVTS
jgi:signal transduction histidine kinase